MNATRTLHLSLVVVWLGTALVSGIEANAQATRVLLEAGVTDPQWQSALIWGGIAADVLVGVALWQWPGRASCAAALAMTALMTIVATVLQPTLWLHPLGPLLKNLPIAAALWLLMRAQVPRGGSA